MGLLQKNYGLALLAGSSCVFGFAPFGLYPVPVLALTVLFALWLRAETIRTAAWLGFAFGLGLFSAGVGWIYVALHDYGDMQIWLALPVTFLFAAFLSLFVALAGYAQARLPVANWKRTTLVMPAVWVLVEWLRGTIFTGFPWLNLGYAHSDSPLSGYAPLLGVYGVSLMASVSAGLLAGMFGRAWSRCACSSHAAEGGTGGNEFPKERKTKLLPVLLVILLALWLAGALLRGV